MSDILRVKVNGVWTGIPAIKGEPGEVQYADIAPTFSSSTAYAAGDYVFYNGALYRFTADHAAGAWNASHATAAQLAEDVGELVREVASAIDVINGEAV